MKIPNLLQIDLGWIRGVDDLIVEKLLEKSKRIEKIALYGCSLVSRTLLNTNWTNETGKRIIITGNEFD